jgi:fructose-1-phosphate kinase PfkB-like protein
VLATARGAWHAVAPAQPEGSAVGAGDAFLAALLLAVEGPCPDPEALRRAVAAGSAVLKSENGDLLTLEEYRRLLDQVEVREIG